jgi:hypothetical protein
MRFVPTVHCSAATVTPPASENVASVVAGDPASAACSGSFSSERLASLRVDPWERSFRPIRIAPIHTTKHRLSCSPVMVRLLLKWLRFFADSIITKSIAHEHIHQAPSNRVPLHLCNGMIVVQALRSHQSARLRGGLLSRSRAPGWIESFHRAKVSKSRYEKTAASRRHRAASSSCLPPRSCEEH